MLFLLSIFLLISHSTVTSQDTDEPEIIPSNSTATIEEVISGGGEVAEDNAADTNDGSAVDACQTANPQWLTWSEWTSCTDSCGSCGLRTRTRTCLTGSSSCACEGNSTLIEYCNIDICRYPRSPCCNNYVVTSQGGRFVCLQTSTFVPSS